MQFMRTGGSQHIHAPSFTHRLDNNHSNTPHKLFKRAFTLTFDDKDAFIQSHL